MKAVIIDDERLARVELRRLLAPHHQVEIVGEAANNVEARPLIDAVHPDLLLLDVQMPGGSGFDLLEQLDWVPQVIFTTAFDTYALQAFEVNALDYLVKPIAPKRLASALERVEVRRAEVDKEQPRHLTANERIFVKDGERCWFVQLRDIALFESEGNYTRVCFASERPLILRSLQALEDRLDSAIFFRANRRQIVNLQAVRSVEPSVSGGLNLTVQGGFEIEMSRRRAAEFRLQMSL